MQKTMNEITRIIIGIVESLYDADERTVHEFWGSLTPTERQKFAATLKEPLVDDLIDVPQLLDPSLRATLYTAFNQLSFGCGTGELSLHFYSEIKCCKYSTAFESGIGLSTTYILLALIENARQVRHYTEKNTKSLLLDDGFFRDSVEPVFYIDCRDTDHDYLDKVKRLLRRLNSDKLVKIEYVGESEYSDHVFMTRLFEKCDFINLDKGRTTTEYWDRIFAYYGFDKVVCVHHLGYLLPSVEINQLSKQLFGMDFSVALYPIVEKNKYLQNGCLKIGFANRDRGRLNEFIERRRTAFLSFIKNT